MSVPLGAVVDRFQHNTFVCKTIQGVGMLLLFASFALLGPIKAEWFGLPPSPRNDNAAGVDGAVRRRTSV
jgi:hypothetical protein